MPPRRQKLCLHYLEKTIKSAEQLKTAFVKCAAAETFLSWNYFKAKNGNNAQTQLKAGKIPPEFLRSMFNTYGDYRDICLGKDIGNDVDSVKNNINKVFIYTSKVKGETIDTKRQQWWKEHGPEIWEGMLCALEKSGGYYTIKSTYNYKGVTFSEDPSAPKLSTFAERPQFLRWMTEWGEHFCKERIIQLDILKKLCKECTLRAGTKTCDKTGEGCQKCTTACRSYKTWLETWQGHYEKQNKKFLTEQSKYEDDPDVRKSENAYKYLETKLENITCTIGNTTAYCNFMEEKSYTNGTTGNTFTSLDYPPIEIEGRCTCKAPTATPKREELPSAQSDETMNNILKSTIPVTIVLALGSIAFLFIKVIYIYIYVLFIYVCYVYMLYIYKICIYIEKEKSNIGTYL